MTETVLLETHETRRRLLQNAVPLCGGGLLLAGIAVLAGARTGRIEGVITVFAGAVLMALAPRCVVRWQVTYKGHTIRFENNVVFGERLYIDRARFTGGMLGHRRTLQGVIRTGEGAGDRITAESEAGLTIFKVRLVAESPAGGAGAAGRP